MDTIPSFILKKQQEIVRMVDNNIMFPCTVHKKYPVILYAIAINCCFFNKLVRQVKCIELLHHLNTNFVGSSTMISIPVNKAMSFILFYPR